MPACALVRGSSPPPSLSHDLGWGTDEAALLADAIRFIGEHCEMADGRTAPSSADGLTVTFSGNHPESRKLLMAAAEAVGGRRGGKLFVTLSLMSAALHLRLVGRSVGGRLLVVPMASAGTNKRKLPSEPEDDSLVVKTELGGDDGGQTGTPLVSPSAGELGASAGELGATQIASADYLSLLRVATSAASSGSGPTPPGEDRQTPPGEDGHTPPGKMKPIGRPPALTVDTSVFEVPEPVVPKTPANMRSLQRTEMHATVCAGDLAGTMALLAAGHRVNAQEEHGF